MLEQIRGLCTEKGITIFQLERDLDFGNGTVRKWKNSAPGSDKLKRVADYFGVTVDALLRKEDKPDAAEP